MDYQEYILRPSEESRDNKLKGHIIEVKGFLIDRMKRENDIKEVKKFSKAIDELDKAMGLL